MAVHQRRRGVIVVGSLPIPLLRVLSLGPLLVLGSRGVAWLGPLDVFFVGGGDSAPQTAVVALSGHPPNPSPQRHGQPLVSGFLGRAYLGVGFGLARRHHIGSPGASIPEALVLGSSGLPSWLYWWPTPIVVEAGFGNPCHTGPGA